MKQIQLKEEEIQSLIQILDAGVKTLGLSSAVPSAIILQKIQGAEEIEDEAPLEAVPIKKKK